MEPIVFIDSGDTLVDESTEERDENNVVLRAEALPGAKALLEELRRRAIPTALVADGLVRSFHNIYEGWGLWSCFQQTAISEEVGVCKPDGRMFEAAMKRMKLCPQDKPRILMVGNNLERDVTGANEAGLVSVLLDWSPRYRMTPLTREERPDYRIHRPLELLELLEALKKRTVWKQR